MADAVADFPATGTSHLSDAIWAFGDRLELAFQAFIAAPENQDRPQPMPEALNAYPRAA